MKYIRNYLTLINVTLDIIYKVSVFCDFGTLDTFRLLHEIVVRAQTFVMFRRFSVHQVRHVKVQELCLLL